MEVKSLFDPATKQETIDRINKLTPESKPLWGKMNASQMLAHLIVPMGVADGTQKIKRTMFGRIVGPIARPFFYNEKPVKKNLPTAKEFNMQGIDKNFEAEKKILIDAINKFSEASIINETHPFFGHLTKEQWAKGTWKHLDHHLQQFGV